MGRSMLIGAVLSVVVIGIVAPAQAANQKSAAASSKNTTTTTTASTTTTETAGPSMSVDGDIVLRQDDPAQSGMVYLRVKDSTERVWLMAVDPAQTTITINGAATGASDLVEGEHVSASFPRGTSDVPMATAVSVTQ